jgi:hypothetical protein
MNHVEMPGNEIRRRWDEIVLALAELQVQDRNFWSNFRALESVLIVGQVEVEAARSGFPNVVRLTPRSDRAPDTEEAGPTSRESEGSGSRSRGKP